MNNIWARMIATNYYVQFIFNFINLFLSRNDISFYMCCIWKSVWLSLSPSSQIGKLNNIVGCVTVPDLHRYGVSIWCFITWLVSGAAEHRYWRGFILLFSPKYFILRTSVPRPERNVLCVVTWGKLSWHWSPVPPSSLLVSY